MQMFKFTVLNRSNVGAINFPSGEGEDGRRVNLLIRRGNSLDITEEDYESFLARYLGGNMSDVNRADFEVHLIGEEEIEGADGPEMKRTETLVEVPFREGEEPEEEVAEEEPANTDPSDVDPPADEADAGVEGEQGEGDEGGEAESEGGE